MQTETAKGGVMTALCRYCGRPITFAWIGNRSIPVNLDGSEHEKTCPEMRRAHNKKTRQRASVRRIEQRGEDR